MCRSISIGRVLSIQLYTQPYQASIHNILQYTTKTQAPEVIKGRRYLVILCESRLVVLDMERRRRRDASSKHFFGGSGLTSVAYLFKSGTVGALHIAGNLLI